MSRARRTPTKQYYNSDTDMLSLYFSDLEETVAEDTPSGLTIGYHLPDHEMVRVEVMRYCLRFGPEERTLHIDSDDPFDVRIDAVSCQPENMGFDLTEFNKMLGRILPR